MRKHDFIVELDHQNRRLDRYLVDKLETVSRTQIKGLIDDGFITVNDSEVKTSYRVQPDDKVTAVIPDVHEFKLIPEDIPLEIVFEDDYLVVINKPAGLVVHPAVGNWTGTLMNGLVKYLKVDTANSTNLRPGLVHRLDKDTSGLLIAAKSEAMLNAMQEELRERRIKRHYQALVWGHMREEQGRIELPIGRSDGDRRKMSVREDKSREAITKYELISRYKFADHLELALQTGRTHQIRVHCAHLGHPVIGDPEYGGDEKVLPGIFDQYRAEARQVLKLMTRQALHAWKLQFKHPVTHMVHIIKADLPTEMIKTIEYLKEIEARI